MSAHNRKRKHRDHPLTYDPTMSVASAQLDDPADRQWLHDHPDVPGRIRPATVLEKATLNLPEGTQVTVFLMPDGGLVRGFSLPEAP